MMPGDMPDFDPALQMAHDALTDPDATSWRPSTSSSSATAIRSTTRRICCQDQANKVTITTVGVATHGAGRRPADGSHRHGHRRHGTTR